MVDEAHGSNHNAHNACSRAAQGVSQADRCSAPSAQDDDVDIGSAALLAAAPLAPQQSAVVAAPPPTLVVADASLDARIAAADAKVQAAEERLAKLDRGPSRAKARPRNGRAAVPTAMPTAMPAARPLMLWSSVDCGFSSARMKCSVQAAATLRSALPGSTMRVGRSGDRSGSGDRRQDTHVSSYNCSARRD